MGKPKWKITRQISTGKLLFDWRDRRGVKDEDTELIPPCDFKDILTFVGLYSGASTLNVVWKSQMFNGSRLTMKADNLNKMLSGTYEGNSTIVNVMPFTIQGHFEFVKRGSEIRIIELK